MPIGLVRSSHGQEKGIADYANDSDGDSFARAFNRVLARNRFRVHHALINAKMTPVIFLSALRRLPANAEGRLPFAFGATRLLRHFPRSEPCRSCLSKKVLSRRFEP